METFFYPLTLLTLGTKQVRNKVNMMAQLRPGKSLPTPGGGAIFWYFLLTRPDPIKTL